MQAYNKPGWQRASIVTSDPKPTPCICVWVESGLGSSPLYNKIVKCLFTFKRKNNKIDKKEKELEKVRVDCYNYSNRLTWFTLIKSSTYTKIALIPSQQTSTWKWDTHTRFRDF